MLTVSCLAINTVTLAESISGERCMLSPWQGDVTLMRYIEMNFHDPNISSTKSNLEILQALYDLPLPLSPVGHLLTALCMLHSDKTVRALAGELWIEKLRYPQGINSAHIGDILGQLEKESWAPLKRFTDLAMQSLINISFPRHNQALLEMVSAMDKPFEYGKNHQL